MILEEAIKHAEEKAAKSCDECKADHEQLAAWLKELKEIKENSIVISNTSSAWSIAKILIDAVGRVRVMGGISNSSYRTGNIFDVDEIKKIGTHLINYASVEGEDEYEIR